MRREAQLRSTATMGAEGLLKLQRQSSGRSIYLVLPQQSSSLSSGAHPTSVHIRDGRHPAEHNGPADD
jgi:hypothetical protein